jgi:hypothetical protein
MKKQVLLFIMMVLPMMASAYDAKVDGIYYNLISKAQIAIVTNGGDNSYSGNVIIPETISYGSVVYDVTSIGDNAFYKCSDLTSVSIPNSVTSIGSSAFKYCYNLTSVNIHDNMTSIGDQAFYMCSRLKSVTIPTSVTSIGYSAFYECVGLTAVYITNLANWCQNKFQSNPLYYAHHLYLNGGKITSLIIPDGVTSISNDAFVGCSDLISVTIPNSVTSIGSGAFCDCI